MTVPAGDWWRIRRNARVSLRSPLEGPRAFARCVRYQAADVTPRRRRRTFSIAGVSRTELSQRNGEIRLPREGMTLAVRCRAAHIRADEEK